VRLDIRRAPRLTAGALLSTTMAAGALVPSVASSDTQSAAPAAPTTAATPVATKASASLSISSVRRTVLEGRRVVVRGVLRPAGAGRAVSLQVRRPGGGWTTTTAPTATAGTSWPGA
jgi:hypothetical protein